MQSFLLVAQRNPNSVEIRLWKKLECWKWRCNFFHLSKAHPLVWNTEMVTSLCFWMPNKNPPGLKTAANSSWSGKKMHMRMSKICIYPTQDAIKLEVFGWNPLLNIKIWWWNKPGILGFLPKPRNLEKNLIHLQSTLNQIFPNFPNLWVTENVLPHRSVANPRWIHNSQATQNGSLTNPENERLEAVKN